MVLNKKKRTVFFWIFFVLFFIVGFFLILYVNNIKIDFKHKKILQTGGIFLKVQPKKNISVYLDNKKQDISSLTIFQRLFFDNLFPKKYNLKVEKNGYFQWQKNLDVKAGIVTAASHIILLPKNIESIAKKNKIKDFDYSWFLNSKYILFAKDATSSFNLFIYSLEKNAAIFIAKIKKQTKIKSIKPFFNNKGLILLEIKAKKSYYYLIDISNIEKNKISTYLLPMAIPNIAKDKLLKISLLENKPILILVYQNSVYFYNIKTKTKKLILKTNYLKNIFISNQNVFFITKNKFLMLSSFLNEPETIFNKNKASIFSSTTKLTYSSKSNNLAFLTNKCLYLYNLDKKLFFSLEEKKFTSSSLPMLCSDNIKNIFFDSSGKKIIVNLTDRINVYYLANYFSDYIHKTGEYDILPFKAVETIWYKDGNHFFIKDNKNNLLFSEIDTRDTINAYTITDKIIDFYYSRNQNTLFILKKGVLVTIDLEKYL